MKYIIDIPFETDFIAAVRMEHGLPVEMKCKKYETLELYTEPDRKTIEDAQEEAWKMASKCLWTITNSQSRVIFGMDGVYVPRNLSYQDAKAKYETWEKQRDEIHVGDEVEYTYCNKTVTFVVIAIIGKTVYGFNYPCNFEICHLNDLRKTGRYFSKVAELLKQMVEGE